MHIIFKNQTSSLNWLQYNIPGTLGQLSTQAWRKLARRRT